MCAAIGVDAQWRLLLSAYNARTHTVINPTHTKRHPRTQTKRPNKKNAARKQGLIPAARAPARASTLSNARAVLTVALLDEDVGAILGKRGQTLTQIQSNAKVAIKISDRSKMDPHTHEREVTLSGSYAGIQLACAMISEKVRLGLSLSLSLPPSAELGGRRFCRCPPSLARSRCSCSLAHDPSHRRNALLFCAHSSPPTARGCRTAAAPRTTSWSTSTACFTDLI